MTPFRSTLAVLAIAATLVACSRSGPAELLEIAELEERQTNVPHAKEVYREILERYPDSPQAKSARERLAALEATEAAH